MESFPILYLCFCWIRMSLSSRWSGADASAGQCSFSSQIPGDVRYVPSLSRSCSRRWRLADKQRSRAYQIAIERALKRALQHEQNYEKRRQRKIAKGLPSNAPTPPQTPGRRESTPAINTHAVVDTEKDEVILYSRDWRYLGLKKRRVEEHQEIKPSFRDINPIPVMIVIFKKPTNAIVLLSSSKLLPLLLVSTLMIGILFAAQYTVTYTAAITLAA
jgi:hypothetical protein